MRQHHWLDRQRTVAVPANSPADYEHQEKAVADGME